MNDKRIYIGIIEPSQIVFEGLSSILHQSNQYYRIYRIDSFLEIQKHFNSEKFRIIITNPTYIQLIRQEFNNFKKSNPSIIWVALVYNFYDKELLSQFDGIIQITDAQNTINNILDKLVNADVNLNENISSEQLSSREKEVLIQLINGHSNKEIAEKLNISIHTVISHRKNITQKTGIKSQSGLTIYAISNKIVNIDSL